jgi:hypothetical protein
VATEGLRHRILQLCAEASPVPEITFAGPVDEALAAEASDQVLGMLRAVLGQLGTPARSVLVCIEAGERLNVTVIRTGLRLRAAGDGDGDGSTRDLTLLREQAHRNRGRDRPGRRRNQTGLECSAAILGRRSPLDPPNDPDRRA